MHFIVQSEIVRVMTHYNERTDRQMDGWEGGEQRYVNVSYRIIIDRWEEIDNMDIRETTIGVGGGGGN